MTPRIADAEVQELHARFARDNPAFTPLDLTVAVGFVVIRRFLGDDWVAAEVHPRRGVSTFFFMPAPGEPPTDDLTNYMRQDRIVRLARLLRDLEHLPGFDTALKGFRSDQPASVLAELAAAEDFLLRGHSVEFNEPTGVLGADFDLRVRVHELDVAVEVKSKSDLPLTPYSDANIRNTVKDAAKQLPSDGPGILMVALPGAWWRDIPTRTALLQTLTSVLTRSGRISGIIASVDQWVPGRDRGMARVSTLHPQENPSARYPIPAFSDIVGGGPQIPNNLQLDWVHLNQPVDPEA